MQPRGRRAALGIALTIGAFAAACTGSGDETSNRDGRPTGDVDASTLRIAIERPRTIDPAAASPAAWADLLLADLFYDTLTAIGDDGQAAPGLATFSANTDRTVWRFTLEPDSTFADGQAITADDVVFSIERARGLGLASLPAIRLEDVQSVAAIDARTVDITLRSPSAVFPELLAAPLYPILDPAAIERSVSGADQTPNASSPYSVTFDGASLMTLRRRTGDGPETILITFHQSSDAAFDAFLDGDADLAPIPSGRSGEATQTAGSAGIVAFQGLVYLGINTQSPPLDDVRLRRAIASAIDRNLIVDGVYGQSAAPLDGFLPTGVIGGGTNACLGRCSLSLGTAQALVDQAYPEGQVPTITIATDGSDSQQALAGVLGSQLEAIDVPTNVVDFPSGTFEQLVTTRQHQLFIFGWLGLGRSPQTYLEPLLRGSSPDQIFGIADEALDAALTAARTEPVPAARTAAWAAAESIAVDLVPAVPLVQFQTLTVRGPRIERLDHRVDGTIDLDTLVLRDG